MLLNLNHIGQIALPVTDVDRAEKFYENVIGWRKLYRFADLSFFDVRECVFSSRKQMTRLTSKHKAASISVAPTSH